MTSLIKRYKKEYFIVLILAIIVSVLNVVGAQFLGELLTASVSNSWNQLINSTIFVVLIWGCYYIFNKIKDDYNSYFKTKIHNELRNRKSKIYLSYDNDRWEEKATSEYLSDFTSNIDLIDRNLLSPSLDLIYYLFTLVFSFVALACIHFSVSVAAIIMFLVLTFLPKVFQKKLELTAKENATKNEELNRVITDCLNGRFEYIQYKGDKTFIHRIFTASKGAENSRYKYDRTTNTTNMFIGIIGFFFQCIFIFMAALLSMEGICAVGSILSVGNLAGTFTQSASQVFSDLMQVSANKNLITFEEPVLKDDVKIQPKMFEITDLKSIIRSENTITYNHLNLKFEDGKKYLIVGKSGSGKSTMIRMLFHNNYVYDGIVNIDNTQRNRYSYLNYIDSISYMNQDAHIFSDSIRNNICMSKQINEKTVFELLDNLQMSDFMERCHHDLNYYIEDEGANISGGERQRLCLARAILSNKKYLVLDESLSAIDKQSKNAILSYLLSLKDKTIILIAHNMEETNKELFDQVIDLDINS